MAVADPVHSVAMSGAPDLPEGILAHLRAVCATLPEDAGGRAGAPAYLVLDVAAGAAPPARVHLYHLGAEGFRVVGLERPGRADAPRP